MKPRVAVLGKVSEQSHLGQGKVETIEIEMEGWEYVYLTSSRHFVYNITLFELELVFSYCRTSTEQQVPLLPLAEILLKGHGRFPARIMGNMYAGRNQVSSTLVDLPQSSGRRPSKAGGIESSRTCSTARFTLARAAASSDLGLNKAMQDDSEHVRSGRDVKQKTSNPNPLRWKRVEADVVCT